MLKVIRAEKWDETYKFVVIVTNQRDKVTRQRMEISQRADKEEIKKKVGEWFKNLYTAPKPGRVIEVRLKENDKTVARIAYHHEDIDGFYMVLIDGEWYYTLEY